MLSTSSLPFKMTPPTFFYPTVLFHHGTHPFKKMGNLLMFVARLSVRAPGQAHLFCSQLCSQRLAYSRPSINLSNA